MNVRIAVILCLSLSFLGVTSTYAIDPPQITAKGIAIYGWKDNVATPILLKKEHQLFPIASLTKLITAKIAEDLYLPDRVFTISKVAAATEGTIPGIVAGATFTRDDLLKALLINSSNDAAVALMEPVGAKTFIDRMNDELHTKNYTTTSFINPSGLDPSKKSKLKPNRLTPYHLTEILNDIYLNDSFLAGILDSNNVEITNLTDNTPVSLKQTNALFRDDIYKNKMWMSKTGLTNMAGQNLAFVTDGGTAYDYVTVVFLGSKGRTVDSKKLLDWLDLVVNNQNYGG